MNTTQIVSELTAERDRLNAAIAALGGGVEVKRRGRPRRMLTVSEIGSMVVPTATPSTVSHRSPIAAMRRTPRTSQQRAEQSLRMKQIWAKRRKNKIA